MELNNIFRKRGIQFWFSKLYTKIPRCSCGICQVWNCIKMASQYQICFTKLQPFSEAHTIVVTSTKLWKILDMVKFTKNSDTMKKNLIFFIFRYLYYTNFLGAVVESLMYEIAQRIMASKFQKCSRSCG